MDNMRKHLLKFAGRIELILAAIVIVGMTIGIVTVVKHVIVIPTADVSQSYELVQSFLSMTMLIVIGVELVFMILSQSTVSVLDLVLFAIARKMLIYSDTMLEILLATISIAIVFAVKKYLVSSKHRLREERVLSAATPIKSLNFADKIDIPEEKARTIGGLLSYLAEENYKPLKVGEEYSLCNHLFKILSMEDGVIKDIQIKEVYKKERKVKEKPNPLPVSYQKRKVN